MKVPLDRRERQHIAAALNLLEAHAYDGYAEAHNFKGQLPRKDRMTGAEVVKLRKRLEA